MTIRMPKPTDIPLDSPHGRRDETGRTIRLTVGGTRSRVDGRVFMACAGRCEASSSPWRDCSGTCAEDRANKLLVGDAAETAGISMHWHRVSPPPTSVRSSVRW